MGAAPSTISRQTGSTRLVDVSLDLFTHEILPQLDLSSIVSLSFSCKFFNGSVKINALPVRLEPGPSCVSAIVANAIQNEYVDLAELLIDYFSDSIRYMEEFVFSEIIASALKRKNAVFVKIVLKKFARRFPYIGIVFRGLAECRDLDFVLQVFKDNNITINDDILIDLVHGAMVNHYKTLLDWILSRDASLGRNVILLATLQGNIKMIEWGISRSAGLNDLRNILVAALTIAAPHPNAIEILNYIFPKCNTYDPALLLASAEIGKVDVFEWALAANTIAWDVEQVFGNALRYGQLAFCDYLLNRYRNNPKVVNFNGLHSVIASMSPKVLEYAHKKLKVEFKGITVFVMFLSNYRGRPEDHLFWNYMKSEVLKESHEKIMAQFKKTYGTVWRYARFPSRGRFTLASLQFFESIGFPVSEMDISAFVSYLDVKVVKSLVIGKSNEELMELFKVCAAYNRIDLALFLLNRCGGFIDPDFLVVIISHNQRPLLEYAFHHNPSSYSPTELFARAVKKRSSWENCSWDCFAFLLSQGASLPSSPYLLALDQNLPPSFLYILFEFGAKIESPDEFRSAVLQKFMEEDVRQGYLKFLLDYSCSL